MECATFNAKCEGVEKAASFRDAFKARRCIVRADLYYEWKKLTPNPKGPKQPYAVARADGLPLLLAGLWETWKGGGAEPLRTFTILTTAPIAGSKIAELHHRVPVVLSADDVAVWLGERQGDLPGLMKACPDDWLRMWKVSVRVGNVKNNDRSLIDEAA
jgi:putative SOS response-associated peptidase YedK